MTSEKRRVRRRSEWLKIRAIGTSNHLIGQRTVEGSTVGL